MPERASRSPRSAGNSEGRRLHAALSLFLLRCLLRRPRDTALTLVAATAIGAIVVNGLYLQPGPHPAPLFALGPSPVAGDEPTGAVLASASQHANVPAPVPAPSRRIGEIISDVQRELASRGYYDGAVDGAYGARTDAAIRDFEQAAGRKPTGEPSEELLRAIQAAAPKAHPVQRQPTRKDPIADLLAPQRQIASIQRALSEFGYGQVTPNGLYGPETKAAIERFERERKLPVTGQVSDRLARELAAVTGRPL